jgi:NitT/TauT family transport system substrate-binding protein
MQRRTLLWSLGALAVAGARPAAAQVLAPLKLGTVPQDSGAECYYGHDAHIFAKHGIDAQINGMASGPAIAAAVLAGALDIGFSNMFSLEAAYDKGLPFVLVAPASVYDDAAPTSLLVVQKDSPIASARDLTGKTVSTNGLRNIGEYGPAIWIDKNGGDSSTVKFVEIPNPEIREALLSRRIDAANVSEPALTDVKPISRVLAKSYTAIAPHFLIGAWFTTAGWAAAHPDLLGRFVAAMRETADWSNAHQGDSAGILAKSVGVDVAVVRNATRARFGDVLTPELIQPTIDVAVRYKLVTKPLSPRDLIYSA